MRVTAGKFGGRVLAGPSDATVRPTSDKVRQAIFNVLSHRDFGFPFALEGARVVDLFAGTGAYCLFVEEAPASRALIRDNVEALGLTGISKIWRRDATKLGALDTLSPFDLAFLDPPYRKGLLHPALSSLREGGWLNSPALAIAEMAEEEILPPTEGYAVLDERLYGDTKVAYLRLG
jgi:16S rRNA (guanine966-N2)-methyltransferase